MKKHEIKGACKDAFRRFLLLPHGTQEEMRRNAWEVSHNRMDWLRRVIYGYILERMEKPAKKRDIENEAISAIEVMKNE
jgi:hypothetical protein